MLRTQSIPLGSLVMMEQYFLSDFLGGVFCTFMIFEAAAIIS